MRISIGMLSLLSGVVGWLVIGFVGCEPTKVEEPQTEQVVEEKQPPADSGESVTPPEEPVGDVTASDAVADASEAVVEDPPAERSNPVEETIPEPNPNVGKIRWSATTTGVVKSIALSPDEKTVYVAANSFTAYDLADGKELWALTSLGSGLSAPLVAKDGMIYVGSDQKKLYAINPTKQSIEWSAILPEAANFNAPAMSKDGQTIYVVSGNALFAFKGRGENAWSNNFVLPAGIVSAPTVANDGTIYVCGKDATLQAVNADGTKKWEKSVGTADSDFCSAPAIDVDGTIYVGGNRLYAFMPNGDVKWSRTEYGSVTTAVVIHQTFVYFATFRGKLYKVNRSDGKPANILWENGVTLSVTGDQLAPPTIGAGGIIYIGAGGTQPALKFISPNNGKGLENITTSRHEYIDSPAIAKDGTLLIGNSQGTILAIWTNSFGLANSPWPRATHDNQNSGAFR